MSTYKTAYRMLSEAIRNPADRERLQAAKGHPKLKNTLRGFTQADFEVLQKVFAATAKRTGFRLPGDFPNITISAALPGNPFTKKRRGGRSRSRG